MNELSINCSLENPEKKNSKVVINIENQFDGELLYKYMIGCNGTWRVLKNFTCERAVEWIPEEDGKYIIMVQAKSKDSNKSFDYVSRMNYIIGDVQEKLINSIILNKDKFALGDKIRIFVDSNKTPLMYRYWIRIDKKWQLIRDYSIDNTLFYTLKSEKGGEILVECKDIYSKSDFDDFKKAKFSVEKLKKVEIVDFKCLSNNLIEDSEISFKVISESEENRTILYKFFKINSNREVECIQNYSTKKTVSYVEKKAGDYKLLCFAKDMYSADKFDDRAIFNFSIKKYKDIIIKNFTTDLNSPQLQDTNITISSEVIGGKQLLYKYVIEGEEIEDSGYISSSSYVWRSKKPGKYKLMLFVKDKSYTGDYETCDYMNFIIDHRSSEPVVIQDITLNKDSKILKGETIRAVVSASGGLDLRYSFIIIKDGKIIQKTDCNKNNWIEFTPDKKGFYEFEGRVRDIYSKREYDCHLIKSIEVFDYIPANIDYILCPVREYHMVGDKICISIIAQDTKNIIVKYIININGHKVEETDFIKEKNYAFLPKCSGKYTLDVLAKNIQSDSDFDCKKHFNIDVRDAVPITDTKVFCEKNKFFINKPVTFYAYNEGGLDVLYEFYTMEKGDWTLVQNYSKKNNYTFVPFDNDEYKIMVLCKSQYSNSAYEDYDIFSFKAN
ncbi:triple tyrosine motif-containing protein [Clostridium tyrobutyricum]|uniref:SpoIID-like domain containing protein, peptidoglycan-binding domain n=2 Tax=Clostridium tyrobutyricum TaxID=1519 RepID=W6N8M1_CLOTY|nr:triple tyrosine motif-containing protein [Clostridium tyrobutyricum]AND85860.1 hypothetical protein CTK_C26160 [Clostridium tyrobutyricum]ANP70372.1 triple tyrosine motif-containing protein [Clostridium tyrobutyricum]MBV4414614.1 triple tyrosine motif-containing protein [Clostridium tyrobutyricum]MBV4423401.1 triple tyrosine motif-containing protein [Clostridium tyrobutyricum]MBV4434600.1 triple tyrosine motif-containing protein [Clostridium tyrobutyricum]